MAQTTVSIRMDDTLKKNMEETRVVEETHRPADSEKNDNKSGRIGIICAIAGLLTLTVTVVLIIKKIKKRNL